jgi:tRNA A37 threonylcarbamoyltransferase TsaD
VADEFGSALLIPPQSLATDNAAMIGIAGWQKFSAHGGSDLRFGPEPDQRLISS